MPLVNHLQKVVTPICILLLLLWATQAMLCDLQEGQAMEEGGVENSGESEMQRPRVSGEPKPVPAALHLAGVMGEQNSVQLRVSLCAQQGQCRSEGS